jgi:uncharacterized protein with NRDE domain
MFRTSSAMCLLLFAHRVGQYSLAVAANRDEAHARPSLPAAFWPDAPDVLGGRDRLHGGTWLGLTRGGRFAAITNFRDGPPRRTPAPSRGSLVRFLLTDPRPLPDCLGHIRRDAGRYHGFSLLAGDGDALWFYSNREDRLRVLEPGIYGLSNHLLDTPWPKVVLGKRALASILDRGGDADIDALLGLLADPATVADPDLPDTGIDLERERALSALFIRGESYGTRCSTVLLREVSGRTRFVERSFSPDAEPEREIRLLVDSGRLPAPPAAEPAGPCG